MMTKKMKILTTNIQNPLSSCKVSFYTEVTYICLVKGEQLTTNTQNSYSLVLYKHIHPCRPGRIRIRICPCVTDPVGPPPYWKKSLKFVPGRGKPLNICLHWEKLSITIPTVKFWSEFAALTGYFVLITMENNILSYKIKGIFYPH